MTSEKKERIKIQPLSAEEINTFWVNPKNEGSDLIAHPDELAETREFIETYFNRRQQDEIVIKVRKHSEK
jgi:hypothetical protein